MLQIEESYKAQEARLTDDIGKIKKKIEDFKNMNAAADKKIMELKCDITDQQMARNLKFEESVNKNIKKRLFQI